MERDPRLRVDGQGRIVVDDMMLVPAGQSRSRTDLLPARTEDASHVLGKLDIPPAPPPMEARDYLPETDVEWVIDVQFEGKPRLIPQLVSNVIDQARSETLGRCTIYGRDTETGLWTFLISAGGPQAVNQLKFAFKYLDPVDETAAPVQEGVFADRLLQLKERMRRFGDPLVSASLPPTDAVQRAQRLFKLRRDLDMSAVLRLRAPAGKRFDGKQVWDTMLCLGLRWGDMDCFHWDNPSGMGDDSLFSVETTTPPGYFLPEEVAAGRVNVEDLVFVFSVPRSVKPVAVFDSMARAVNYCQTRLGGAVEAEVEGGAPGLRQMIVDVERQLREAGFEPGANATLRLF